MALTKNQIKSVVDVERGENGNFYYVLQTTLNDEMEVSFNDIATQTIHSTYFSGLIEKCECLPDEVKNHKDILRRIETIKTKIFSVSKVIWINNDKSSLLIYDKHYNWLTILGIPLKIIVEDIINQYKKQPELPIKRNAVLKDIKQVCF